MEKPPPDTFLECRESNVRIVSFNKESKSGIEAMESCFKKPGNYFIRYGEFLSMFFIQNSDSENADGDLK